MNRALRPTTAEEAQAMREDVERLMREHDRLPEGSSVAYVILAAAFGTCMGVAYAVAAWVF